MRAARVDHLEVTLSLVDDREIRALNRDYREIDRATDVLSFSMFEDGVAVPTNRSTTGPSLLGDIVISVSTAKRQAGETGLTLEEELLRLAVHGLAHLCGYDHRTRVEELRMFRWEAKLRAEATGRAAVRVIPCPTPGR